MDRDGMKSRQESSSSKETKVLDTIRCHAEELEKQQEAWKKEQDRQRILINKDIKDVYMQIGKAVMKEYKLGKNDFHKANPKAIEVLKEINDRVENDLKKSEITQELSKIKLVELKNTVSKIINSITIFHRKI